MNFGQLKKLNPTLPLYRVTDAEFAEYGRVLNGLPTEELCAQARKIEAPEHGSAYCASVEVLEATPFAEAQRLNVYGEVAAQVGYCWGHNTTMNAMEWHTGSEVNVAVTPLVLILGRRADVVNNCVDSATFRAFYLEAGESVEVYATSLHYCPCQVSDDGFGCIVGLPLNTNLNLDAPAADPLLFAKNKWLLAHVDNTTLIAKGAVAGVTGENFIVKYAE